MHLTNIIVISSISLFQNILTTKSDEKQQDDFLDLHPDTSRRPTVVALNIRFFAEKPHVDIEVKGISLTSL